MAVGDTLEIIWDTCGGYGDFTFSCDRKWKVSNDRPLVIKVIKHYHIGSKIS